MNSSEMKAVMVKHNDTQEKLAEFLGLQTSGVSARINGKIEFRRSEINAIRQRYGLTDQETIAFFLTKRCREPTQKGGIHMNNPYKTYTVSELIPMIEHTALDLMNEPITGGVKSDKTVKTMAEVSYENSLVVMENNGIRLMANELVRKLSTEEDDPDG